MTKQDAIELLKDEDYEPETYAEAAELFTAIFERAPDAEDGDQGQLFSHCVAAV